MDSIKNISMSIVENTLTNTGMSIIITDYTYGKFIYGYDYRIEEKIDNEWKKIKLKKDHIIRMPGLLVDENHELKMDIDWSTPYGILPDGYYRLIKHATPEDNKKEYEFSVEFEIKS